MKEVWIPDSFQHKPYAKSKFVDAVVNAYNSSPFYQKLYDDPSISIPILSREVVRTNNEALLNGHPETGRTSGSTGVPVRVSWSQKKSERENISNQLLINWMGGRLERIRFISLREAQNQFDAHDVCLPITQQIELILQAAQERNIQSLVTFPSNVLHLSQYIIDHRLDFSFIKRVVCYSEVFDESHETAIIQAFPNARIWITYSCTELGMIAINCPHQTGYHHLMAHNIGVEVLNELDEPCNDGEMGRLVLTDYFNQNMPLIRYEVGDLAIPGECPCGEITLPSIKTIVGKVRGTLKRKDGSPLMFANIAVTLRNLENLKQYQVIQETIEEFTFRFVSDDASLDEEMKEIIHEEFSTFLGFEPLLTFIKEQEIERDPSGKFQISICNV